MSDARFDNLERFDAVDRTGEQAKFLAFLDRVDRLADVQSRRQRSYGLLRLAPGRRVADVGCGIGTAACAMAALVAPGGSSQGIDLSDAMLDEAKRRAAAFPADVRFSKGSADALPLEAGSIDAYRAERLYQHIADIPAALAEARRVLAPCGRIVLVDQDWDAAFLDADDLGTARVVHRAFADSLVQGTVGRKFHRMLREAGFQEVAVEAETVTSANPGEYGFVVDVMAAAARSAGVETQRLESWLAEQKDRMAKGGFFMAMTHFIAHASRG
jgi:ubiquinone/menaquinone biosynthesis C-methylase UbiE